MIQRARVASSLDVPCRSGHPRDASGYTRGHRSSREARFEASLVVWQAPSVHGAWSLRRRSRPGCRFSGNGASSILQALQVGLRGTAIGIDAERPSEAITRLAFVAPHRRKRREVILAKGSELRLEIWFAKQAVVDCDRLRLLAPFCCVARRTVIGPRVATIAVGLWPIGLLHHQLRSPALDLRNSSHPAYRRASSQNSPCGRAPPPSRVLRSIPHALSPLRVGED